jgi:membrane-associated protease RseP (regulator of RpoE activity)
MAWRELAMAKPQFAGGSLVEQDKRPYTLIVATAALAVVLSLCVGVFAGGAAGYVVARAVGRQTREECRAALLDWQRESVQPRLPEPLEPEPLPGVPLSGGAMVTQVVEGGPADEAGIRAGDLILAIDGVPIDKQHTLKRVISRRAPGDKVTIVLWRGGNERQVTVRLGEHPDQKGVAYLGVFYEMVPARLEPFGGD